MNILISYPNQHTESTYQSQKLHSQVRLFDNTKRQSIKFNFFLQGIVESLVDGILILSAQGEIIHANSCAKQICLQLTPDLSQTEFAPAPIWHICQALVESRYLFPERSLIVEDEISISKAVTIRVRVQWLDLGDDNLPYLIAILENRYETAKNLAIAEAKLYHLSERETEVWLLKRVGYTYKEIAAELYITLDTVKKHLKNIHVKLVNANVYP